MSTLCYIIGPATTKTTSFAANSTGNMYIRIEIRPLYVKIPVRNGVPIIFSFSLILSFCWRNNVALLYSQFSILNFGFLYKALNLSVKIIHKSLFYDNIPHNQTSTESMPVSIFTSTSSPLLSYLTSSIQPLPSP